MAAKKKPERSLKKSSRGPKAPDVRIERGEHLPVVDLQRDPRAVRLDPRFAGTPPFYFQTYFRLPARLRTPKGPGRQILQPILEPALAEVEQDWLSEVPQRLANRHLSAAFGDRRLVPIVEGDDTNAWMTVRGVGSPSQWSAEQRRAWADYEAAISKSIVQAEKDLHKEVDKRLKTVHAEERRKQAEKRAEESRKQAEKRAEEKRKQAEKRAQRIQEQDQAAEAVREREWRDAVSKYSTEWLAQQPPPQTEDEAQYLAAEAERQGAAKAAWLLVNPSKDPVVQAQRKRLAKELKKQHANMRFRGLEVSTRTSAQDARARLVDRLREQVRYAIDPAERRQLLARLRRAEAGVLRKSGKQPASEAIGARFQQLELEDQAVQKKKKSKKRDPQPGSRAWKKKKKQEWKEGARFRDLLSPSASPRVRSRGRYSAPDPTPVPVQMPLEIAERIDAEARARAETLVGAIPQFAVRAWRKKFDAAYAEIRASLWREAEVKIAEEAERARAAAPKPQDRFTILEID